MPPVVGPSGESEERAEDVAGEGSRPDLEGAIIKRHLRRAQRSSGRLVRANKCWRLEVVGTIS